MHGDTFNLGCLSDETWADLFPKPMTIENLQEFLQEELGIPNDLTELHEVMRAFVRQQKCEPFCLNEEAHAMRLLAPRAADGLGCCTIGRLKRFSEAKNHLEIVGFLDELDVHQEIRAFLDRSRNLPVVSLFRERREPGGLLSRWWCSFYDFLRFRKGFPDCQVVVADFLDADAPPRHIALLRYLVRHLDTNFRYTLVPPLDEGDVAAFRAKVDRLFRNARIKILVISPTMPTTGARYDCIRAAILHYADTPLLCLRFDASHGDAERLARELHGILVTFHGEQNEHTEAVMENLMYVMVHLFSTTTPAARAGGILRVLERG